MALLELDSAEGIFTLTMNRPESLNALNTDLRRELGEAWRRFETDDELVVAVLRGAGGRAFCVGRDLKESAGAYDADEAIPYEMTGEFGYPPQRLRKPLIAAIDGYCMGSGFRIAMGAHIRLATEASLFANPQILRGRGTEMPLILRSAGVPDSVVFDMCLSGRRVNAQEAHQWGLISRRLKDRDELDAHARELAVSISRGSRTVREGILRAHALGLTRPGTDSELYNQVASMMGTTADARAGAAAFVARGDK